MADYTDFPDNPQAGDVVEKNGRTWYYDGIKYVLFVDPTNTGDMKFNAEVPIEVTTSTESTNNPADQDETRSVVTTSIDLTTLENLQS